MSKERKAFGEAVHILRKVRNLSQDDLDGISRQFISQIESGEANPSLETVFKIAYGIRTNPAVLLAFTVEKLEGRELPEESAPVSFIHNTSARANFKFDGSGNVFSPSDVVAAATMTNTSIRAFAVMFRQASGTDLFQVIDKKQTGAFLGAVFVSSMAQTASGYLAKNPSQTGHPDLIPKRHLNDGKTHHWDQFPLGGVEVKTSCGNLSSGVTNELSIGSSRLKEINSIVWKGHHNKINNLLGLFWDYYFGIPTVLAGIYSNELVPEDFTNTVPKPGGGHTTNVCITKTSAVTKMGKNWVFMVNQPAYMELFKRRLYVVLQ